MLERYTEKRTNGVYIVKVKYLLKNLEDGTNEQIDKLGRIEDIEEKLGIDIVTLFKALENGFYVRKFVIENDEYADYREIWDQLNQDIVQIGCTKYFRFRHWYETIEVDKFGNYIEVWLKDYGKSWALTKEELENE